MANSHHCPLPCLVPASTSFRVMRRDRISYYAWPDLLCMSMCLIMHSERKSLKHVKKEDAWAYTSRRAPTSDLQARQGVSDKDCCRAQFIAQGWTPPRRLYSHQLLLKTSHFIDGYTDWVVIELPKVVWLLTVLPAGPPAPGVVLQDVSLPAMQEITLRTQRKANPVWVQL